MSDGQSWASEFIEPQTIRENEMRGSRPGMLPMYEEEEARHYLEECQEDEESESEGLHTSVDGWGEDDLNG